MSNETSRSWKLAPYVYTLIALLSGYIAGQYSIKDVPRWKTLDSAEKAIYAQVIGNTKSLQSTQIGIWNIVSGTDSTGEIICIARVGKKAPIALFRHQWDQAKTTQNLVFSIQDATGRILTASNKYGAENFDSYSLTHEVEGELRTHTDVGADGSFDLDIPPPGGGRPAKVKLDNEWSEYKIIEGKPFAVVEGEIVPLRKVDGVIRRQILTEK